MGPSRGNWSTDNKSIEGLRWPGPRARAQYVLLVIHPCRALKDSWIVPLLAAPLNENTD